MGSHRRSKTSLPAAYATGGRHRATVDPRETGRRTATLVAATGAIVVGATSMGAGSAAAAPVQDAPAAEFPFAVPEGLLPAGVEIPQIQLPQFELPQLLPPPLLPPSSAPDPGLSGDPAAVQADAAPTSNPLAAFGLPDPGAAAQQWLGDVGLGQPGAGGQSPLDGLRAIKNQTVQPVAGVLTSSFGSRWGTQHGGLDIAAPIGTPIHAAADGTVSDAGPASGFGLWVKVRHDDGTETVYGHVDGYSVQTGQRVAAGEQIATVGNRGQSTGPHLHFEVHEPTGVKVDPAQWLATRGVAVTWHDSSRDA